MQLTIDEVTASSDTFVYTTISRSAYTTTDEHGVVLSSDTGYERSRSVHQSRAQAEPESHIAYKDDVAYLGDHCTFELRFHTANGQVQFDRANIARPLITARGRRRAQTPPVQPARITGRRPRRRTAHANA